MNVIFIGGCGIEIYKSWNKNYIDFNKVIDVFEIDIKYIVIISFTFEGPYKKKISEHIINLLKMKKCNYEIIDLTKIIDMITKISSIIPQITEIIQNKIN